MTHEDRWMGVLWEVAKVIGIGTVCCLVILAGITVIAMLYADRDPPGGAYDEYDDHRPEVAPDAPGSQKSRGLDTPVSH